MYMPSYNYIFDTNVQILLNSNATCIVHYVQSINNFHVTQIQFRLVKLHQLGENQYKQDHFNIQFHNLNSSMSIPTTILLIGTNIKKVSFH